MLICVGVDLCAMGDGYQFKMPGNIVALRGFINQMGYLGPAGTYVLGPQHVAAWGGEYPHHCSLAYELTGLRCLRRCPNLSPTRRILADGSPWPKVHVDHDSSLHAYCLFDRDVCYYLDSLASC